MVEIAKSAVAATSATLYHHVFHSIWELYLGDLPGPFIDYRRVQRRYQFLSQLRPHRLRPSGSSTLCSDGVVLQFNPRSVHLNCVLRLAVVKTLAIDKPIRANLVGKLPLGVALFLLDGRPLLQDPAMYRCSFRQVLVGFGASVVLALLLLSQVSVVSVVFFLHSVKAARCGGVVVRIQKSSPLPPYRLVSGGRHAGCCVGRWRW